MSEGRAASTAAHRVGSGAGRLLRAWRNLPHERRLAAYAAIGLFLTLFLPWYQETVVVAGASKTLQTAGQSLNGWAAFSFVEAAVLLVAAGVLTLLFQRAEGRAFHLPGGDGWVIMAAGSWTSVLVIWRIFDKQGTSNHGQVANSSGIEWGIFVALGVAVFLAYAGSRVRAAHQPEPPLPGEDDPRSPGAGGSRSQSPEPGAGGSRSTSPAPGAGGSRSTSPAPDVYGSRSPSPGAEVYGSRSTSREPAENAHGSRSTSREPAENAHRPRSTSPGPAEDAHRPRSTSPGTSPLPWEDAPRSASQREDGPPGDEWPSARRPVGWLSAPTADRAGSPGPEEPRRDEPRGDAGPEQSRGGEPRHEQPGGEPRHEQPGDEPRSEPPRSEPPRSEPPRSEPRPVRAPRPYPTGEAPAQSEPQSQPSPVIPPSTPAARRRKQPDEPLTIPLERED